MTDPVKSLFVSDTGPLISWARAEQLPLLRQLVGEVTIPEAVVKELDKPGRPGAELVHAEWIRRYTLPVGTPRTGFPKDLGEGEREAIAVAGLLGAFLVIDDASAREEAEKRGIPCVTTLRLLIQAKQEQRVEKIAPILATFRQTGFRVSDTVAGDFLSNR